jgi:uncharacterized protein
MGKIKIAVVILLAFWRTSGLAAGFDCERARSPAEKLICSDPELSRLDDDLSVLYQRAKAAAPDQTAFVAENVREWKRREQTCADKACLMAWYADRRGQLAQYVPGAPSSPMPPSPAGPTSLSMASGRDDGQADNARGSAANQAGRYQESAAWYRSAAEKGFAPAQNSLGAAYAKGAGVGQDYTQAAFWFRKAADQGFRAAMDNLALIYANGLGVPKNDSLAGFWRQKAAEAVGAEIQRQQAEAEQKRQRAAAAAIAESQRQQAEAEQKRQKAVAVAENQREQTPGDVSRRNVIIAEVSGAGIRTIRPFTVDGAWELQWTSSPPNRSAAFYVHDASSGRIVEIATGASGASYVPNGGTFYVEVNTMADWTIQVVNVNQSAGGTAPVIASVPAASPAPATTPGGRQDVVIRAFTEARAKYAAADGDLKKTAVKRDLLAAIKAAVPGGQVSNWNGEITTLTTTGSGHAVLTVTIARGIELTTTNNSFSEALSPQFPTLIKGGSSLFNKLSDMKVGDSIQFDGVLGESGNLTESGTVNDASFYFRFTDVRPSLH